MKKQYNDRERRVKENSARLRKVEKAVGQAEKGVELLAEQWENIRVLDAYMASGEWLADFEADERGEIGKEVPRGVLAEDSLYDVLERLQDVLALMSNIVEHVVFPKEEN